MQYKSKDKPWFIHPNTTNVTSVAIIGGGLAGCYTAYCLAKQGLSITLIEREPHIASKASGNLSGVIYPKFSAYNNAQSRFYAQSFTHTTQHIEDILGEPDGQRWQRCGVLSLDYSDKQAQLHRELIETEDAGKAHWPNGTFEFKTAQQASELAGIHVPTPALFYPNAGWVNPPSLCHALLEKAKSQTRNATHTRPNLTIINETQALRLDYQDNQWHIHTQQSLIKADAVVIANAQDALNFEQTQDLKIKHIRGQTTYLHPKGDAVLKSVICHEGYVNPAVNGLHSLGASFNLKDENTKFSQNDHQENIAKLKQAVPDLLNHLDILAHQLEDGRVCFRCQAVDYLPVVGPVANRQKYIEYYTNALKGHYFKPLPAAPCYPNLYINVAHGSRGISQTGLCAELISSYIMNTPHPVDEQVRQAMHPARFIIKDIKRKQV